MTLAGERRRGVTLAGERRRGVTLAGEAETWCDYLAGERDVV